MAMHMEREAFHNTVFLSEDTKVLLGDKLKLERVDSACWKLLSGGGGSSMCSRYLRFPMNKRFSLVTVPQAINRVLQQSAIANCKMVEFFSPDGWMRTSLPCIPKTASLVSTVINFPTIRRKSTAPPDDRLLCDKLQETGSWPFSGSQIHGCSGDAHLPVVRRLSQSFRDPNTENGEHLNFCC
jgi:hypothetical protein